MQSVICSQEGLVSFVDHFDHVGGQIISAISFRSVRDAIKLMRSDTHVNSESKVSSLIRAISFVEAIAVQMVRSCTTLGLRTMSGVKSTSSALSEVTAWESAII